VPQLGKSDSSDRPNPFSTLIAPRSGVRPARSPAPRRLKQHALRIGVHKERARPSLVFRTAYALLGRAPAFTTPPRSSALRAGTRPPPPFVLTAHFKQSPPACNRRTDGPSAPGFSSRRTGLSRSVIRISALSESRRPAAAACSPRSWFARAVVRLRRSSCSAQSRATLAISSFEPLQCRVRRVKALPRRACLHAQIFLLDVRLPISPSSRSASRSARRLSFACTMEFRALPASVNRCIA